MGRIDKKKLLGKRTFTVQRDNETKLKKKYLFLYYEL